MKAILINPPSKTYRKAEEHLGLSYLKATAKDNGHKVDIIDAFLLGMECDEVEKKILSDLECKLIGLSPYIDSLEQTLEITKKIKAARKDIVICWGGHLATFSALELMEINPEIDIIVRGEGEIIFCNILDHFFLQPNKSELVEIHGIVFRDGKYGVVENPAQSLITDLNTLPFPARDFTSIAVEQGSLVQISGSRGCYGNCSFCSINSLYRLSDGRSWRGRTAENIVDEIYHLNKNFGFSDFKFVDDSFFGPGRKWQKRAYQFANELKKRNIKIRFRISARANNIEASIFRALKDVGLYSVSIGIESGFQRALNTFNKGVTVKQNKKALLILKKLGIFTLMGFIGFDPYSTLYELEENLDFLKQTTFCMSDIISKPLYIHAQDPITLKLLEEGRIHGRDFPNYSYVIEDKKAQRVLIFLQAWNSFNKNLFYDVADKLTAPRITSKEEEIILFKLHQRMRILDLEIYELIISLVKSNCSDKKIKERLKELKEMHIPIWREIQDEYARITKT